MVEFARANFSHVVQGTSLKSKMPGQPWRGLWPCWDQGVIPVGFARAVQPAIGPVQVVIP